MGARRLTLGPLTSVVLSLTTFLGTELLLGDLAEAILGLAATPETVAAFRGEFKLDFQKAPPFRGQYDPFLVTLQVPGV